MNITDDVWKWDEIFNKVLWDMIMYVHVFGNYLWVQSNTSKTDNIIDESSKYIGIRSFQMLLDSLSGTHHQHSSSNNDVAFCSVGQWC